MIRDGYNPRTYYETDPELRKALNQISSGYFCPNEPGLFTELVDDLLNNDRFKVCADFKSYIHCQERVNQTFQVS